MKKLAAILLTLCCISALSFALADADHFCNEIPQTLQALVMQENPDGVLLDCVTFEGMPMGDVCFVLTPWSLDGYILQAGGWRHDTYVNPMSQDGQALLYLRRHEAGAAGQVYEDTLGFDVVRGNLADPEACDVMQFHWLGEELALVGWQKASSDDFAIRQDDRWAFFDKQTGSAVGDARIDTLTEYGVMASLDDLPDTYAEAKAMEAITRTSVEKLFDGWTLAAYRNSFGRSGDADYYRIEDGMLTIRHTGLESSAGGVAWQRDTLPVPLSARLLERLETEPFDTLIDVSGESETFKTEDAFDQAAIPVTDKVLQSDLQTHGLMLLCEGDSGSRYLYWVERQADGSYLTRTSQPMPADTTLDLFHCGDDAVIVSWQEQRHGCSFSRNVDGSWSLNWCANEDASPDDETYGTAYCGIQQYAVLNGTSGIRVGSQPWGDLFSIDLAALPKGLAEATASLDRAGWAVVNNPDPADRLHLRVKPDRTAESLGKFYNHTPVRVLAQKGDWSHVVLGADGRLEGWMLTAYLTFGDAMDAVEDASPQKTLIDTSYKYKPLYASPAMQETTGVVLQGWEWWIAGVVDDTLYVLMDCAGHTGYMPQSWFFDGNG